ncbi:pyruvate carboxyltransferase [Pseudomonas putida ND6]|uniref:Pyruvate carboxyltransferase n=1 Tax=Pseudomonas putida ND6 TaxID=231023 RepID=I3V2P1_PSEPU|nr:pyruvate carboxyltransferase [Pseudomonas putida ND6]
MTMAPAQAVKVFEVGPRDGLQNERQPLSVAARVSLIGALASTGLRHIEAGAFVSPRWVPQMAGSEEVLRQLPNDDGVRYAGLVPNLQGFQAAQRAGCREVAVFAAASEAFSRNNINCSIDDSFERFIPVLQAARQASVRVRGYVSCVLGCPFSGAVTPEAVAKVARRLHELGCYEISLGDTIGAGRTQPRSCSSTARSTCRWQRWPAISTIPGAWPSPMFMPRWRKVYAPSTVRSQALAAAPTRLVPAATWPRKICCTCCTAWATAPVSTWRPWHGLACTSAPSWAPPTAPAPASPWRQGASASTDCACSSRTITTSPQGQEKTNDP